MSPLPFFGLRHHGGGASGPPVNTSVPTISGTPAVGEILAASPGSWTNSPSSFLYKWRYSTNVLIGEGSNYLVESADVGKKIFVEVIAKNAFGEGTAQSAQVGPVTNNAPTITSFSPTSGPSTTVVAVKGTNLTGITSVLFGATSGSSIIEISSGEFTVHPPAGTAAVKITVKTPGGEATSTGTFQEEEVSSGTLRLASWGWNKKGATGPGWAGQGIHIPYAEEVKGLPTPAAIKEIAGPGPTSYVLMTDGSVYGFGANENGQLGIGGDARPDLAPWKWGVWMQARRIPGGEPLHEGREWIRPMWYGCPVKYTPKLPLGPKLYNPATGVGAKIRKIAGSSGDFAAVFEKTGQTLENGIKENGQVVACGGNQEAELGNGSRGKSLYIGELTHAGEPRGYTRYEAEEQGSFRPQITPGYVFTAGAKYGKVHSLGVQSSPAPVGALCGEVGLGTAKGEVLTYSLNKERMTDNPGRGSATMWVRGRTKVFVTEWPTSGSKGGVEEQMVWINQDETGGHEIKMPGVEWEENGVVVGHEEANGTKVGNCPTFDTTPLAMNVIPLRTEDGGVHIKGGGVYSLSETGQKWSHEIKPLENVVEAAIGHGNYLYLLENGEIWATGLLWSEETEVMFARPLSLTAGIKAVKIATSAEFGMALLSNGHVKTFGRNKSNGVFGLLGDGEDGGSAKNGGPIRATEPVRKTNPNIPIYEEPAIETLSGITDIACATYHGLALKSNGTVWAWGRNAEGECGQGNVTENDYLSAVQVSGITTATEVGSAGDTIHNETHYSQLSGCLLADGTARLWGGNNEGEMGTNVWASPTPTQPAFTGTIKKLSVGQYTTLAAYEGFEIKKTVETTSLPGEIKVNWRTAKERGYAVSPSPEIRAPTEFQMFFAHSEPSSHEQTTIKGQPNFGTKQEQEEGIRYVGVWQAGTNYKLKETVMGQDSETYYCIKEGNSGLDPRTHFDPKGFLYMSGSKLNGPNWYATEGYSLNSIVYYNNLAYISIQGPQLWEIEVVNGKIVGPNLNKKPDTETAFWKPVTSYYAPAERERGDKYQENLVKFEGTSSDTINFTYSAGAGAKLPSTARSITVPVSTPPWIAEGAPAYPFFTPKRLWFRIVGVGEQSPGVGYVKGTIKTVTKNIEKLTYTVSWAPTVPEENAWQPWWKRTQQYITATVAAGLKTKEEVKKAELQGKGYTALRIEAEEYKYRKEQEGLAKKESEVSQTSLTGRKSGIPEALGTAASQDGWNELPRVSALETTFMTEPLFIETGARPETLGHFTEIGQLETEQKKIWQYEAEEAKTITPGERTAKEALLTSELEEKLRGIEVLVEGEYKGAFQTRETEGEAI